MRRAASIVRAWLLCLAVMLLSGRASAFGTEPVFPTIGPLAFEGRILKRKGGDLIEVDPARGVIVRRTTFPAPITAMVVVEGVLRLTLTCGVDSIEVPYRLGTPQPGR